MDSIVGLVSALNSKLTVQAGQSSGHRVGTIGSPASATNVPSCLAVSNFANQGFQPLITSTNRLDVSLLGHGQITNVNFTTLHHISSNIQDQLDDKLNLTGGTTTGNCELNGWECGDMGWSAFNYYGCAHTSNANSTSFALLQAASGQTVVNCASGSELQFRQNNVLKGEIASNGQWTLSTTLTAQAFFTSSDDRLKHNETPISNATQLVSKLRPYMYEKTDKLYDGGTRPESDTDFFLEAGFIAQDVAKIPELAFAVRGGDFEDEDGQVQANTFTLDYQSLFVIATQAIQELTVRITTLEAKL
jgi:hypothetical protein